MFKITNIDIAGDGRIVLEKYNTLYKKKLLFEFIFIDIEEKNLKGKEAAEIIREMVKSSEAERKERMDTSSLMEQILSSDNLNRAYLQVVRNKGAEGVDGMKYTELGEHFAKNGENIKEQLRTRKSMNKDPFKEYIQQRFPKKKGQAKLCRCV